MSAQLSRINQAYYLGVNEFLGREPQYNSRLLTQLGNADSKTVQQSAEKYFAPSRWVTATAGPQGLTSILGCTIHGGLGRLLGYPRH
jgi:predicted Zn-dependent peptidase